MGSVVKLPRIKKKNQGIITAALANYATWIEYVNNLTGAFPVKVSKTATGPVISIDLPPPSFYGVVMTAISAGDGRKAYGSGVVNVLADTGSTPLVDTGTSQVVKNIHEKGFVVSAVVWCESRDGSYWAVDVGKCADYGP